jgi:CopG family transcriptional regulator/antitoxin EndoAI
MDTQTSLHNAFADQDSVTAFCEYYGVDAQALSDATACQYVQAHAQDFDGLIDGYRAMASLNEEICAEFTACEAEADSDLR